MKLESQRLFRRSRGVTMVELIVVIGLVAILAAVIGPRFVGRDVFASRGFFDEATETVRYAQKLSVAWRRDVYVCVAAANLRVSLTSDCASVLAHPVTGAPLDVSTRGTVDLPTVTFRFIAPTDTLAGGQPTFALDASPIVPAQVTINFTNKVAGDPARRIVVERETGYVHN